LAVVWAHFCHRDFEYRLGAALLEARLRAGTQASGIEGESAMTPRQRRLTLVIGVLAGVAIAGGLTLRALRENVMFFFDPSQVVAGQAPVGERFRLGGMVKKGSVQRTPGSLEVNFIVTDFRHELPVRYTKVLPDLFREGQGVVAHGRIGTDGIFVADEVLAKHDEKYMPPELARALKKEAATPAVSTRTGS
jgi:cytochrome c-type biogenesis protein CcmE